MPFDRESLKYNLKQRICLIHLESFDVGNIVTVKSDLERFLCSTRLHVT